MNDTWTHRNVLFYFMATESVMCAKQALVKLVRYLPDENSDHVQLPSPHMFEPKSGRFVRNVVLDADQEVRFFDPATRAVVDSLEPTAPTHRVLWMYVDDADADVDLADRRHAVGKADLLRRV